MGTIIMITKTGIVPINCRAWDESFSRAAYGKRAIAMRGWGSLNQALLSAPEILNTEIVVSVEDDDSDQK